LEKFTIYSNYDSVEEKIRLMSRKDVLEHDAMLQALKVSNKKRSFPLSDDFLESMVDSWTPSAEDLNKAAWECVKRSVGSKESYALALSRAKRAFDIELSTPHIVNTLGVAYYRVGRFDNAIDTLRRSLPLNVTGKEKTISHPADTAFLALSHMKLGNKDEAAKYRAMFDEAMKIEANSKDEDYQSFQREIEEAFGP